MVGFELSEEERIIKETVGAFAREQLRPRAHPCDEGEAIPPDLLQAAWDLGLVQGAVPEAFGGAGEERSAVSGAIVAEELAWGDLALALHVLAPRLIAYPLIEFGTPEQQRALLPRFCGQEFAAASAAVMEPRLDFDLSALATRAERTNGGYRLSGRKCVVPLARSAEVILVLAQADDGLAGLLVERDTEGLHLGEREKLMGIKALETVSVDLDGCTVPSTARLGGEQADLRRLVSSWRVALAALAVGVGRAAFEYARDYAKERTAFGRPIATRQAIAFMLGEMAIEVDAARLLTWEAAWKLDRGEAAERESYLAKTYAANMVLTVADNAVQALGGHGYIRDHPTEMWLRNARGFASWEGLALV